MLALIEGWLPVIWIAVAVALAVIAGHLRSRLPVALGLCAVPALGWLFVEMFC